MDRNAVSSYYHLSWTASASRALHIRVVCVCGKNLSPKKANISLSSQSNVLDVTAP
ncbi:hypothetical protein LEMLEM_LOCUS22536, partial [Lemmus lemmus]